MADHSPTRPGLGNGEPDEIAIGQSLVRDARCIFQQALAECSVERAIEGKLRELENGVGIRIDGCGDVDVTGVRRVIVIALGKAGTPMLRAFLRRCPLPPGCSMHGVLIAPSPPETLPEGVAYFAGGHPSPNRESFRGARAALNLIEGAASHAVEEAICFFLISGGGSAMMELPLDLGISLEDTIAFHQVLVGSGASIAEINCVRKHFSAVKGGRLAVAAGAMRCVTMLVSDVPPRHLDAISSGPTLADPTTMEECRSVLERYDLLSRFPPAVRSFLRSPLFVETPKEDGLHQSACVMLSSDDLAGAARRCAESMGYAVVLDHTCDDWDYRDAAEYLVARLRAPRKVHPRLCLISAGEVTVEMQSAGRGTQGGRNLHFALHCATLIRSDERIAVLSAGSDGVDGNSPAAGAALDAATIAGYGRETEEALRNFATFDLLDRLGATIVTGPTGNNLRDLRLLLAG